MPLASFFRYSNDTSLDTNRRQVLIADDDPDLRALIAGPLRRKGFEVIEKSDGAELVEFLGRRLRESRSNAETDNVLVLVTDVSMPKGDGLSITAALRQSGWKFPVILMSALDDHTIFEDATELAVSAFFHKPFDPWILATLVDRLASPPSEGGGRSIGITSESSTEEAKTSVTASVI